MKRTGCEEWTELCCQTPFRLQWDIIIQVVVLNLCFLAAPATFSWDALLATLLLVWLSGQGINLGYHRLLSHGSFKTSPWFKYTLTLLGMLANQGPPITWVGTHRLHHRYTDQPGDPHSPAQHFWWAQYFWIFLFPHRDARRAARDLVRDRGLVLLDRFYYLPQLVLILILYAAGGFPWVVWGYGVRVGIMLICTSFVNSVGHRWGYRNFDTPDASRNSWWVALLTYGEGWHNNHHADPRCAAHGLRWWEVDFSYLTIRGLLRLGLVYDVRLPPTAYLGSIKLAAARKDT
jgi:fatty-acid desaturase